ncbi:xanthine dehydrogenase family protein molybdopterin-binding subunit [Bradyrhizobium lablabi]|jgi:nicotinate dehydrogenase subunit B|uniref:xanthine dehydrogenase family protein molybdopterin-binding subunit n=1 Tax=Bradyrhizobium lablabi TaxID=722472 RepID=UPI00090B19B2|nr:molybdopterin cofactor-binding domain-containing protein [Bradyrhizobium lablabi]SHM07981.1 CO or xanthine dehydrogenase, Mo-binding subunit [Bradyrhizobium lablabi]
MMRGVSRRSVLAGAGALIVAFRLSGAHGQTETGTGGAPSKHGLPGSLDDTPSIDAWIRLDASGAVTILTGKAELGQGLKTALLQVAAEELKVPLDRLSLVTADTARTPNEGYTAASHSMQDSGTAIRHAAAQAREILIEEAARRLGVSATSLQVRNGDVFGPNRMRLGYGELVRDQLLSVDAKQNARLTLPADFTVMNQPVQRIDIPAKVTGGSAYVQDLRLDGMLHGRVVRPPSYGATLRDCDIAQVERISGIVKVVQDNNFLGVLADQEWIAIQGMRTLAATTTWIEQQALPDSADLPSVLTNLPSRDTTIHDSGNPGKSGILVDGTFSRPYLTHGSIGPSCAVAQFREGRLTVWTHTQGVFFLRDAIADMLWMPPENVRCIHAEGAGCYGHNGADDAAADAAMLAVAMPGRPVRVQLMREQEHAWDPFGPGMVVKLRATVGLDGAIADWHHEVWSQSHMMRPGPPGTLVAARLKSFAFPPAPPVALAQPEGGGDRNAIPLYAIPNCKVINHFLPDMPLRGSSMRSLGGYLNVLAIESVLDELAARSGQDPVAFRLRHTVDPRAREVIEAAASRFGWAARVKRSASTGFGFGFARYKNLEAWCAVAIEIELPRQSGGVRVRRVVAAVDTGQVVNPDGIRNQIEGGILQSMSWTLFERVTFDRTRVTSVDWSAYPIMRFDSVPESVEVHLIDRPGDAFYGVAEAAQGPTGAAIANAIRDATGVRMYELPFTAARIKRAAGL